MLTHHTHTNTHTHTHTHTEQVSAAVTFCTCVRKVPGSDFFRSSGCCNRFVGGFSSAPDECRDCILGHDFFLSHRRLFRQSFAVRCWLRSGMNTLHLNYHNMNMYRFWRKTPHILQLGRHGGEWYRKLPRDICCRLFPHPSEFTIHNNFVPGSWMYGL